MTIALLSVFLVNILPSSDISFTSKLNDTVAQLLVTYALLDCNANSPLLPEVSNYMIICSTF